MPTARPEVESLKDAIAEVARAPITFPDAIALAAARQPLWRASEQLSLAEQAVWELLHEGRLQAGRREAVDREHWQPIVLRWSTWSGTTGAELRLTRSRSGPPCAGDAGREPDRPTADRVRLRHDSLDQRLPLLVGREQEPADPLQAGDVVDVAVEVGDEDRIGQPEPPSSAVSRATLRRSRRASRW